MFCIINSYRLQRRGTILYKFTTILNGKVQIIDESVNTGNSSNEGTTSTTGSATEQPANETQQAGGLFDNPMAIILIYVVGFAAVIYFFSIRPQKKKERQMQEMQATIKTGDNVLTTSGMYGKIVDIRDEVFIVEFGTNKGVNIPIRKADVVFVPEPNLSAKKVERIEDKKYEDKKVEEKKYDKKKNGKKPDDIKAKDEADDETGND